MNITILLHPRGKNSTGSSGKQDHIVNHILIQNARILFPLLFPLSLQSHNFPKNILSKRKDMPGKPKITYPCSWTFRIIGENSHVIESAVASLIPNADSYSLKPGNISKKGKYVSLHLHVVVLSDEQKNSYKQFLLKQSGIHFIL